MENALQALKMAASVLIFIIAITTSFVMFSKAKATTDSIIRIQDRQAYLESPDVRGGILYTSSEDISGGEAFKETMTTDGNRIVKANDVISSLYRYWLEQYNVTIISNNNVIARYDSDTESILQSLKRNNTEELGKIEQYISNIIHDATGKTVSVNLKDIYKIESNQQGEIKTFGAPWLGTDTEVIKRINAELAGKEYISKTNEKHKLSYNLREELEHNTKIVEYFYIKDNSKYLEDNEKKTNLLLQNEHSTIEVVYILE